MQSILVLIAHVSLITISFISLSKCDPTTNATGGLITIDLHHPDLSSTSPHYDPSLSHFQRVANALHRKLSSATTIENNGGFYSVRYSIGTPPVAVTGIFETGSDLIWTPCKNLRKSSSLQKIACNAPACKSFPERDPACTTNGSCSYQLTSEDGSSSKGILSTETITLGSVQFPKITFGCADENKGGVFGLGGGAVSLVRQLGKTQLAYCLVSINSDRTTSKLHLGDNIADLGKPIPLVRDRKRPTFYYANLESITVGNTQKKPATTLAFRKNVILDTGTGATLLPRTFYNSLLGAIKTSIGSSNVTKDPQGAFDLCYKSLPARFPDITLKFETVDLKWKQENVFAQLDAELFCFAASWVDDNQDAVFGNIAQVNFLVGFDLNKNTVTFKPTDCGRSD